jgi:uncharacterized protein
MAATSPAARLIALLLLVIAVAATSTVPAGAQIPAGPSPNGYVTMADGTSIAISVHPPAGWDGTTPLPAVFEMSGYDGGSAQGQTIVADAVEAAGQDPTGLPLTGDSRQNTELFSDAGYMVVHASVRGTGCSGGQFDLFSWRSALDGRELIEWIAEQPWSDGRVGITGHSYGGITAFMVAATRPEPAVALVASGLIDDLYRGIVYPGGVSNYGFPLTWTGGVRNVYDVAGGTATGLVRTQDPQCAANLATRSREVLGDPILNGLADTDNDWWRSKSLYPLAELIDIPVHIWGAYQDQETGPRGPAHLWELVREDVPKRLVLSNGFHDGWRRIPAVVAEKVAWMDHWMGEADHGFGTTADPEPHRSARVLLEVEDVDGDGAFHPRATIDGADFPLPQTDWQDWHLQPDGGLAPQPAPADGGSSTYLSGSPRQSYSYQAGYAVGAPLTTAEAPDELRFLSEPFAEAVAIAGPVTATLHLASTAPDTELFVQLVDVAPDGSRSYLQRGMLRASHRAVRDDLSDRRPDGSIYRPWRPHTNPALITPGEVVEYLVEVFPIGHVLRPGHRLAVEVKTPPAVDSFYVYVPRRIPAINTLWHDAARPSRVVLPVVPLGGQDLGEPVPCGRQQQVRCVAG